MSRNPLHFLVCGSLLLAGLCAWPAAGSDGPDKRQQSNLKVQVTLQQGLGFLQKGEFAAAVAVLEKDIALIDGNARYLAALRDAYRGYVKELQTAGRTEEARRYQGFLDILDPVKTVAAATPPAAAPAPAPSAPSVPTVSAPAASAPLPAAPVPAAPLAAAPAAASERTPDRPAALVPRGKIEDDPFSDANSVQVRSKRLVERGEKEFAGRHYEEAARLYAQAETLDPGSTSACQERWAYCRLYAVAQSVNRAGGERDPAALEREIREALRLAPKLSPFGDKLLASVREGSGADVEVKHTKQGAWSVAETANFRIFHAATQETAERIARKAEATRVAMTQKWFDEEARPWSPRCDLYVHPTGQDYAKATGAPAASPGHSTISLDAGRVVARRIDLRGDDPNLMAGVLPHETTHVVLAGRFGAHHVPRWADEGIAVLSEPRDRIDMHLRTLPAHYKAGDLFKIAPLLQLNDYPDRQRVAAFYAQSVSVVEFLVRKKDAATFTRFLRDGLEGGYAQALQKHYGYASVVALEQEWKNEALGATSVAAVSEGRK